MGKLFGAILIAMPMAAFAIWAYLHQTQIVETRIDTHEVRFQVQADEFDRDFARAWGWEPDPLREERIQHNRELLAELEERRAAQRATIDDAAAAIDAELARYEGGEAEEAVEQRSTAPEDNPAALIDAELRNLDR